MDDLISVIIPVYNMKKYLRKCVASVLSQTYKALEIILIDDGSNDGSAEICDEYCNQDTRIKVVHKNNGGLSDARNRGLQEATGKWISFVDSDDFIRENMLETLINMAIEAEADMAVSGMLYQTELGVITKKYMPIKQTLSGWDAIAWLLKTGGGKEYMCNKLYKKHLFENISFPKAKIFEDSFVMYQLMALCNKIVFTPEIGYYYIQRKSSLSKGLNLARQMDILEAKVNKLYYLEAHRPELVPYSKQEIIQTCGWLLIKLIEARRENNNNQMYKAEYTKLMAEFRKAKQGAAYPYFTNRITVLLISISPKLYYRVCNLMYKKSKINKRD